MTSLFDSSLLDVRPSARIGSRRRTGRDALSNPKFLIAKAHSAVQSRLCDRKWSRDAVITDESSSVASPRRSGRDALMNPKSLLLKAHSAVQRLLRNQGRSRDPGIAEGLNAPLLHRGQKRRQRPQPNQRILSTSRPGTDRALMFLEIEMT